MTPKPSPTPIIIAVTLCLCAAFGVLIEGLCILYKVPDMNMPIGQSFTHVLDTIIGGLIGAFVGHKIQQPNLDITSDKAPILNQPEIHP